MKRRVIQRRVVVFLLLLGGGAIVNLAVAWSLTFCIGNHVAPTGRTQETGMSFLQTRSLRESQGWPMQSVEVVPYGPHNRYTVIEIWNERLPYKAIWPGFAINTIFYAAILGVVFFVPGKLKRTLRRRRGLCPACAYPVGCSPVCTECGNAIASN